MKNEQKQLLKIIKWISAQEDISLTTRRDFLAHLNAKKSLDEKSLNFINTYLEKRKSKSLKNESYLEHLDSVLTGLIASESGSETSLKNKIEADGVNLMNSLSRRFVSLFRLREGNLMKRAESAKDMEDSAQIARLKAAL